MKKEDSVPPIGFKEASEHLNDSSSMRTVHPKDVWPKITRELTCQAPVTTLFPWQGVTKSVDPVSGIHTEYTPAAPGSAKVDDAGVSLQHFCSAGIRPFLRKKSFSLCLCQFPTT